MARVEAGLYSILSDSSNLTVLVGGSSTPRIYPFPLPQNISLPALSYHRVSPYRLSGLTVDPGQTECRFEVACYSTNYSTVQSVADKIRLAIWRNIGSHGGVTIHDIWPEDEISEFDVETETHMITLDVFIRHTESTS